MRWLLVVAEMALATVLTVGAVSSTRSFLNLAAQDPGFDAAGVVTLRPAPLGEGYDDPRKVRNYYDEALVRLAAVPGVESVGAIWRLPIAERGAYQLLEVEGRGAPCSETGCGRRWRVAVGLVTAVASSRLLASFLYEIQVADPVALALVAVALIGVAFLACLLPARRAAALDPVMVLRQE